MKWFSTSSEKQLFLFHLLTTTRIISKSVQCVFICAYILPTTNENFPYSLCETLTTSTGDVNYTFIDGKYTLILYLMWIIPYLLKMDYTPYIKVAQTCRNYFKRYETKKVFDRNVQTLVYVISSIGFLPVIF